jgi:putative membrane protein
MTRDRREPLVIDLSETPLPPAPAPAEAPQPEDPGPDPAAARAIGLAGRARLSMLGRLFWLGAGGLLALWLVTGVESFLADLFTRSALLGWAAAGLAGLLGLALLGLALRELAALARVRRIGGLRAAAERAAGEDAEAADAERVLAGLRKLYRGRAGMEAPLAALAEARADTPDPGAMLSVAERRLLAPLDQRAERAVSRAARRVAAATALVPMPALDVLAVLFATLGMIREIAEIYGGRAGTIGSWRLLRAVATHLLATGAVAATDDLLGPMLGGGVLGRLSRRFGEAAVNAALTARVGTAAIEVCRPLPFRARARPRASTLVLEALRGWRDPAEEAPRDTPPQR